jgi:hypothetical protein
MPTADNNKHTLHLHSQIALAIKAAKKKMFRCHREGMDMPHAAEKFLHDVTRRIYDLVPEPETGTTVPTSETRPIGLADDKDNEREKKTAAETWAEIDQGISDTLLALAKFTNRLRDGSFINSSTLALMDGRYDDYNGATPLTDAEIERLADRACGEVGKPEALILLLDEIDRSRFNPQRVGTLVYEAIEAAGQHHPREDTVGRRVVKTVRSAASLKELLGESEAHHGNN